MSAMQRLLGFLSRLDGAKINYRLEHNRDESIMVLVAVPGERWEIEFMLDDTIEVEVFTSDGAIRGEEALEKLFTPHD